MENKLKAGIVVNVFPVITQQYIQEQVKFLLSSSIEVHLFIRELDYNIFFPFSDHSSLYIHFIPSPGLYAGSYSFLRKSHPRRIKNSFFTFCSKYIYRVPWLWHNLSPAVSMDIMHIQFANLMQKIIQLRMAGKISYKKLVVAGRGHDVTVLFRQYPMKYIPYFGYIDKYLPVSKSLSLNFLDAGLSAEKVRILHQGIDLDKFCFAPKPLPSNSAYRIISVGRLAETKGHIYSIQAIELLLQKGFDIQFEIFGSGYLQEELQNYIHQKNLHSHIFLKGELPHSRIIEEMKACDIFILHSITTQSTETEGIPNVLKEAMALGRPVVSTRHSGIVELISGTDEGLLGEEKDFKGMAQNIEALIRMEPSVVSKMLLTARKKVEAEFDLRNLTRDLLSIYRELISK